MNVPNEFGDTVHLRKNIPMPDSGSSGSYSVTDKVVFVSCTISMQKTWGRNYSKN